MSYELNTVLKRYWGYDEFRPMQREIIESVLDGHDTLGLLPTGGGKSITFQVPAMVLPGLTIVVTPLISLMKDQVDNLLDVGIRAVCVNSTMSRREQKLAIQRCELGKAKILYLSPEKLQSETFASTLRRLDVSMIVVDEAHCISQWGYDFRPSYLRIRQLRTFHPQAPVLALTASATPEVVDDIMAQLDFRQGRVFRRSFARPNISYLVRHVEYKEQKLLQILNSTSGSSIVYVRSRRRTREIAESLTRAGISADFYHAGLPPEDKILRQDGWRSGDVRVMVATNAFGMGIDKSDVRLVAHMDLPSSLEEYYQEAGRAGRDGHESYAVVITSRYDRGVLSRRVAEAFPEKEFVKRIYELAGDFLGIAVGSGFNSVNEFNLSKFCITYRLPPVPTLSALKLLTQAGYIEFVDEVATRSRLMVLVDKSELYDLRLSPSVEGVLRMVLRLYAGIFADYVYISEAQMAIKMQVTEEEVYQGLLALSRMHVLHYVPRNCTPYIIYTSRREEARYVQLPDTIYRERRAKMEARIEAMKRFVYSDGGCRVEGMLRYFGEDSAAPCGKCDSCRARVTDNPARRRSLTDTIIYLASHPGGATIAHIARQAQASPELIAELARPLIDNGTLKLSHPDRLTI